MPAASIYGFTNGATEKQVLPVQQYSLGDSVINESFSKTLSNPVPAKIMAAGATIKATAPGIATWPNGEISFVFDPDSGFTAAEISTLRTNLLKACDRWAQLAKIRCTEVSSANLNL